MLNDVVGVGAVVQKQAKHGLGYRELALGAGPYFALPPWPHLPLVLSLLEQGFDSTGKPAELFRREAS